jgi:hypothetical protein
VELIKDIGAFAGLAAFLGLALLALLSFAQGRDIRRLREWAGSAPERDTERKEATSAAAAEKAEELRRLEEAREEEREAADLREERRRRREAGLPEMTTGERLRESFAGGRSRLADPRYVAALVALLVFAGGAVAFLVVQGSDEGRGRKATRAKRAASKPKPAEIEVTVLNGTSVPDLAARFGVRVERRGFELGAVGNSSSSFAESAVMYEPGSAPEARRVATALEISSVQPMTTDIAAVSEGAPVSVVVGEDNAAAAG